MSAGNGSADVVDKGWAWIVLFFSCVVIVISDGIRMSSGIFYSQFIDNLSLSRPQAASIVAVLNSMFFLAGPIAGLLAVKIGTRAAICIGALILFAGLFSSAFVKSYWALLVTFGFVHGLGYCIVFIPTIGALPLWFSKYRQLAPAVFMASGGLGIFVLAPLVQFLVSSYGWRGGAIVLSGVVLHCLATGATFSARSHSTHHAASGQSPLRSILTNPRSVLNLVISFFSFGIPLFLIFIVRHVTEYRGFTAGEAATLVSICGLTSFGGRVLFVVLNLNKRTATKNVRFCVFNLSAFFAAIGAAVIPSVWSYPAVGVTCGIMGLMTGLRIATITAVTLDIIPPPRFQTAMGLVQFANGVSVLSVPPIGGYLAAKYKSYDPVFYMSCAGFTTMTFLGLLLHYLEYRHDSQRATGEPTMLPKETAAGFRQQYQPHSTTGHHEKP
ncbi:hypothetical protein RvY_04628 [Ramazzottius varieornatus]|uniref:Major facilitator superfamily (MFS) profile domain-containing protein n=1 Tax=Ramazzottius varieornatus TaxID=947166 RepID=A0A1D1USA0_RAMVA|nr:hypothetical protein RvY_04628 [Ramazzottius varieornatus]